MILLKLNNLRFNSIEEIIKVIEKPLASALLVEARESQDKHKLHITGEGFDKLIKEKINGLESDKNYNVKLEVARPTTTRIYKQILNQYQKVFRAKGFFKKYQFKNNDENLVNDFKEYLNDVGGGLSLDQLMQIVWFKASFEEFNGVFLVELPEQQEGDFAEPFIKFKGVEHIHDIFIKGEKIEYIIFSWVEKDDKGRNVKHYRVIDDLGDYHFVEVNGKPQLATKMILNESGELEEAQDVIPNIWGYVPAIQPSQLTKRVDNDILKKSFIEETMSDADSYLSVSNDHAVSVKLHQHPIFYAYDAMCDTCSGTGYVVTDGSQIDCGTCKTSGSVPFWKKDTTQGISVPAPREDEEWGNVTTPAGYVNIDNETIENQIVEMEREEALIEKGALGTDGVLTSEKKQETATGKEIDTQPLFDTLTNFSNNGQFNEQFLTDALGVARYNDSNETGKRYEGSVILWGKQFFVRSTQVIEKEYLESKKAGAPDYFLKGLLEELNFTKYDNNPKAKQRSVILSILEPFVVKTVEEVKELGVDVIDLTIKTYFNDFIERFELDNINVVDYMSNSPFKTKIESIMNELIKYAEEKVAQIEERNVVVKVDIEAEAKANLRGSVGGIQGIVAIQESVASGIMDLDAAQATIEEFFGVAPEVAKAMLSKTIKPITDET
jgi:hypothetical protein